MIFEVGFRTDAYAELFRQCDAMQGAIDQLGPLRLDVSAGRGGGAAVRVPRRGRPLVGAGAAALPIPDEEVASPILDGDAPVP